MVYTPRVGGLALAYMWLEKGWTKLAAEQCTDLRHFLC
jgi:hypothetical protein